MTTTGTRSLLAMVTLALLPLGAFGCGGDADAAWAESAAANGGRWLCESSRSSCGP